MESGIDHLSVRTQAGILGHGYRKALHTTEAGLRHIVTVPIKTRSRIPCTNCANQRHLFIHYTTYTVHTVQTVHTRTHTLPVKVLTPELSASYFRDLVINSLGFVSNVLAILMILNMLSGVNQHVHLAKL